MRSGVYFAKAYEAGVAAGRIVGMVFLYLIAIGVIRLVTKKPLTKKQLVITAIVVFFLALASSATKMSQT